MAIYKDDDNTWKVVYRFTDWTGVKRQTTKRGFKTRRAAKEWESENVQNITMNLTMNFKKFVENYKSDMQVRLKENTWLTKEYIINKKILPYFSNRKIHEISATDIIRWQNEMIAYKSPKGDSYSPVYLKTLQNQLSAIFNHAVKHYGLKENPVCKVGNMGKSKNKEMLFWTKDEYVRFSKVIMDKPISYYAFELLYWTGIRLGELLALTANDFNLTKQTLKITKSYQRIKGSDVITTPKTEKSVREISMPKFLCDEIEDYINSIYGLENNDRLFPVTKSYLHKEMDRGVKLSKVKRIRIHDIRHSHVSLLIDMGFTTLAIAERVGHESILVTYRYAHLFPSKQKEISSRLDQER